MFSPSNKEFLRQKIANSGKNPRRYRFLVKLMRRVLWPFMRPYFYTVSDYLSDLEARLNTIEEKIKASGIDTGSGVTDINCLKTDLISLKNRLSVLDK